MLGTTASHFLSLGRRHRVVRHLDMQTAAQAAICFSLLPTRMVITLRNSSKALCYMHYVMWADTGMIALLHCVVLVGACTRYVTNPQYTIRSSYRFITGAARCSCTLAKWVVAHHLCTDLANKVPPLMAASSGLVNHGLDGLGAESPRLRIIPSIYRKQNSAAMDLVVITILNRR
jgi:hypothetical protein